MDKNKLIMCALIVIILAFLVGIFLSMPNFSKADSKLEIIGNDTITEGSNIQIKLTDNNGTALINQTVKITFTNKDNSNSDYSVVTNEEGVGELKLDKNAGEYDVTVIYNGNDNYMGCNATKKINIEKEVAEAEPAQNQAGSQSNTHIVMGEDGYYFIVDDNGNILQNLGPSKKYYPNNPNSVDYPNAEPSSKYIDKSK